MGPGSQATRNCTIGRIPSSEPCGTESSSAAASVDLSSSSSPSTCSKCSHCRSHGTCIPSGPNPIHDSSHGRGIICSSKRSKRTGQCVHGCSSCCSANHGTNSVVLLDSWHQQQQPAQQYHVPTPSRESPSCCHFNKSNGWIDESVDRGRQTCASLGKWDNRSGSKN